MMINTRKKIVTGEHPGWMFVVFPAAAMMLGWGLRGHIGGGPFGAMIPGAFVALTLCMLLRLPDAFSSIVIVFAVTGIGLGGEMTYGQTLGFLRNPDTMWWGTLGTTLKGSVWGLLGGSVLATGFLYRQLNHKIIIIAFLLLLLGMLIGFKLINQPMIIYFSDPANPRPESWGALLVGAFAFLVYLKYKLKAREFKIIFRFALFGMAGGSLGFGLGGFWMVLGNHLPVDIIFRNWWKAMEFTFGLLLGAALGYATWLSREDINTGIADPSADKNPVTAHGLKELTVGLGVGLLIYCFFPYFLDTFVETGRGPKGFTMPGLVDIAIILSNYAFYGLIMVVAVMIRPPAGWQIGITLTFCHCAIDLIADYYPESIADSRMALPAAIIIIMTLAVALLVNIIQSRRKALKGMFLLIVWSCIFISLARLKINPESLDISGLTLHEIVFGKYFVNIFFVISAIFISWFALRKIRIPG